MLGWDIIYSRLFKIPLSPIKSVQRGATAGAGSITINAVNTAKTVVLSKSKGSAGTVAATGNISLSPSPSQFNAPGGSTNGNNYYTTTWFPSYSGSISGGTTNLTTKEYSATLSNSTTIYCDGPVEWQVIEFV